MSEYNNVHRKVHIEQILADEDVCIHSPFCSYLPESIMASGTRGKVGVVLCHKGEASIKYIAITTGSHFPGCHAKVIRQTKELS